MLPSGYESAPARPRLPVAFAAWRPVTIAVGPGAPAGPSVEVFNDIDRPDAAAIEARRLTIAERSDFTVDCPAYSVSVLSLD